MLKIILTIICLFLATFAHAAGIKQFVLDKTEEIPDIKFADAEGNIHKLSDYKGKVVLVNFWSTWCDPCVHEMPALAELAGFMMGKDFELLPISIDSKGKKIVQKFYEEGKLKGLPILTDEKGLVFQQLKLQALPTSLLIDRHGRLIAKIMGEIDWSSKETHDYILGIVR